MTNIIDSLLAPRSVDEVSWRSPNIYVYGTKADGSKMREVQWNNGGRCSLRKWCKEWRYDYSNVNKMLNQGLDWRREILPRIRATRDRMDAIRQRKLAKLTAAVGPNFEPDLGQGLTNAINGIVDQLELAAQPLGQLPRRTKRGILALLKDASARHPMEHGTALRKQALNRVYKLDAKLRAEIDTFNKRLDAAGKLGMEYKRPV